jgi:thiol-disulfide isomerase/thioredoxin
MADNKKMWLTKPVAYLTSKDFDGNGNIINSNLTDKKVVIMIQAAFCGYCTMAKPAFQDLANKNQGKFFCATIQGDGKEAGEKELNDMIKKIDPTFRGFPGYVGYKNGKYIKSHSGGRSIKDLENFANSF